MNFCSARSLVVTVLRNTTCSLLLVVIRSNGHLMLSDFGLAFQRQSEQGDALADTTAQRPTAVNPAPISSSSMTSTLGATSIVGTPLFIAPEILFCPRHSRTVDFWSLGVLTFYMIYGVYPFGDIESTKKDVFSLIASCNYGFPTVDGQRDSTTENVHSFIVSLIDSDPARRLGSGGLSDFMKHEFMSGVPFDDLLGPDSLPEPPPPFRDDTSTCTSGSNDDTDEQTVSDHDTTSAKRNTPPPSISTTAPTPRGTLTLEERKPSGARRAARPAGDPESPTRILLAVGDALQGIVESSPDPASRHLSGTRTSSQSSSAMTSPAQDSSSRRSTTEDISAAYSPMQEPTRTPLNRRLQVNITNSTSSNAHGKGHNPSPPSSQRPTRVG